MKIELLGREYCEMDPFSSGLQLTILDLHPETDLMPTFL
jgi:hypothetical protein